MQSQFLFEIEIADEKKNCTTCKDFTNNESINQVKATMAIRDGQKKIAIFKIKKQKKYPHTHTAPLTERNAMVSAFYN